MNRLFALLAFLGVVNITGCTQPSGKDRDLHDACEGCELIFDGMPKILSWETTLNTPDEPGESMVISGTIFKKDGRTPAADIILYVYHTDYSGLYSKPGTGGNRHGHLRGWVKTGTNGEYKLTSIRPAPYPNGTAPAHIHPIIKEPGVTLYSIDEYLFDDDPNVTSKVRAQQRNRGGNGIIHLTKNNKGIWVGKRDIVLGINVPNY